VRGLIQKGKYRKGSSQFVVEWEEEDHAGGTRIVVIILSEEDEEDHGDSIVPGSNWRP
jgi:hypothetical protein